jgi:hypothetical protein
MAFTTKLMNPTPFPVKLDWDRGVKIRIAPFSSTDLTMQQLDDFRPGKPGSADVKSVLDYFGLFLMDVDRPYDNQAFEALQRSYKAKKAQYDTAVKNITDQRAATGIAPNPDALEETLKSMGYGEMRRQIEVLGEAVTEFHKAVGDEPEYSSRPQLDPKRSVFVTDPPREFPSVAAMDFFLKQNPEVHAKHKAFLKQKPDKAGAPTEAVSSIQELLNEQASDAG